MLRLDSLFQINRLFLFVFFLSILRHSDCQCVKRNSCECTFANGSVIDLSSLGNENNTPRFENMKATKEDNFTYFYNPCYSFKMGPEDGCGKGVSACQVSQGKEPKYNDIGDTESVTFYLDSKSQLVLIYITPFRRTNVTLFCSEDAVEPELTVLGETVNSSYEMTLKSRCACPDLCQTSHLSTGSVLVIIFMIFVSLYLVLGIIHSSLTRGAHGWELIPHYEFWSDFPLLVRDGCVFVVSGCKPDTAYERI